jgi:hypothetical protein
MHKIYAITISTLLLTTNALFSAEQFLKSATPVEKFMINHVAKLAVEKGTQITTEDKSSLHAYKNTTQECMVACEDHQIIITFQSTLNNAPIAIEQTWRNLPAGEPKRCTHINMGKGKYLSILTLTSTDA